MNGALADFLLSGLETDLEDLIRENLLLIAINIVIVVEMSMLSTMSVLLVVSSMFICILETGGGGLV